MYLRQLLLVCSYVDLLFVDLHQDMQRGVTYIILQIAVDLLKDQPFDYLVLQTDTSQMDDGVARLRARHGLVKERYLQLLLNLLALQNQVQKFEQLALVANEVNYGHFLEAGAYLNINTVGANMLLEDI